MKFDWLKVITGIVLVLALILVAVGIQKKFFSDSPVRLSEPTGDHQLQAMRDHDREVLSSEDSKEERIQISLLRLGEQNLPDSESLIRKFLNDPRVSIKATALNLSGAYDWADMDSFRQALGSSDEALRLHALKGLSRRYEERRKDLVLEFLQKKNLKEQEWMEAQLLILRWASSEVEKNQVKGLISSRWSSLSQATQDFARPTLIRLMPGDDQIKSLLEVN
jgi:hypothetical protein